MIRMSFTILTSCLLVTTMLIQIWPKAIDFPSQWEIGL